MLHRHRLRPTRPTGGVRHALRSCASILLLVAAEAVARGADDSQAVARLAEYGIEPTSASIGAYFASLQPTPERQREIAGWIAQLDSDQFAKREEASHRLRQQLGGTGPLLERAIAQENPEIRWRAREILSETSRESRLVLGAALAVIRHRKLPGRTADVFAILPLCGEEPLRRVARSAIAASARREDIPLLQKQLTAVDPDARRAALAGLAAVAPQEAIAPAVSQLADADRQVQLSAVRVLAAPGEHTEARRKTLAPLVHMLDDEAIEVRVAAAQLLRILVGRETFENELPYRPYAAPPERTQQVAAWQAWLVTAGQTATLQTLHGTEPVLLGRLLLCDHGKNLLIEFDEEGVPRWEQPVGQQPWACQGLPSGHRLVGSYNDRSVVEYDDSGKEIWRVTALPGGPTSIERLEDGNTLIACTDSEEVVEVAPDKEIVWRARVTGRPADARRLENGNTLVTLQNANRVVEIDPAGKEVWEIGGLASPFSAERLPSGNTLVCSLGHNKIREFDPGGRVVWEKGSFANAYSAQRLASGNTLVVDSTGVTEIDAQGEVVRRLQRPNVSRAWKF
jgi:HEAT repeat protein